ncbi:MAG: NAD(P)-dependent glycerol-3-phosphate dehydrogenase [Candidatus Thiodiazotropha sp. (ex Lucina aurantia)]|nr:NAD(P)-dependent glycerol-3-phosphate dehydrogenase [Candidatus Thiodiazotropha taylori]MBT3031866.1 NAD(P)-dependent glycerol-3-phosphate dehydrogenase [Candidatus Thiodiazotropha sp. (ex Lucina pensylvanica)]MBT3037541.1 NAD(P)-dependent glycerol-3-phosphate dehydrogenase [Candidatus Thiodiazotropha sp. (ex Codakia orbicularis)]MBV2101663.1 NAD(P)-dependent glycerol-3-phosphate dehydrogenase [Candidatus Thiodiazotropha sp. (ex Lucina aurantia)]MBT3022628.1 NAD(P)-dependent glycerol-3-phosp
MDEPNNSTIAVLGAGSWGTALAILLSGNGYRVSLWGHLQEEIEALIRDRENKQYLPGVGFPPLLHPEIELHKALHGASEILIAVPSHAFQSVASNIAPLLQAQPGITWATKGFEPGTQQLLSEVAAERLPGRELAVVSGPTFAGEVARGLPTAVTVAATTTEHAERIAELLHAPWFRAYTSDDLVGVQVGGASKNVLAIAAGIADGLGFGANTRAALITRGLTEIMRLGLKLGGRQETFMGLAGLGDLVLTCTDNQSRNRRMGLALAEGLSMEKARLSIGQEVEGVHAAQEVYALSQRHGVEMPISEQVYRVLYEGLAPKEAVHNLLERRQKAEGL